MATQTPNYSLVKPDYTDPVDVGVLNTNADLIDSALSEKQNVLVSGTNIKTINGNSILGSGNIEIQGGSTEWDDIQNKPDTISGYGITDGYTKTEIDTMLDGKESASNKVTSISDDSTDTQYPTAKAVNTALKLKADVEDWDVEYRITFDGSETYGYAKYNKEKWLNFSAFLDAVSLYSPEVEEHHDPIVKGNFYLFGYVTGLQLIPESITSFDYMGVMTIYFNAVNDELGLENKFKCELAEDYEKLDGTLTIYVEELST